MKSCFHFLRLTCCLVLLAATKVLGQEWAPTSGEVIPNSESPDNRFNFLQIFREPITDCTVCISDRGRTKVLSLLQCHTKYGTDKRYRDFLNILWNKSSSAVAVHDSLDKNSHVDVYLFNGKDFEKAKIPDIYRESTEALSVDAASIKSSGQVPLRWISDDELVVEQRLQTKDGIQLRRETKVKLMLPAAK
jgi:hypothetical protein